MWGLCDSLRTVLSLKENQTLEVVSKKLTKPYTQNIFFFFCKMFTTIYWFIMQRNNTKSVSLRFFFLLLLRFYIWDSINIY